MSPPKRRNGGPAQAAAVEFETATKAPRRNRNPGGGHSAPFHQAHGQLYSPYGRRRMWSLIVRRCPACQHLHIHKVGNPAKDTFIKTGSCGADYKVLVTQVLSEAA